MNRIRSLREERGWTQTELGRMLNVKDSAVSKYETGRIPLTADTLRVLSEVFGVTVDYILGLSSERSPSCSSGSSSLEGLSPEAKEKAKEYIEMLKTLEAVKSGPGVMDLEKEG